MAETYRSTLVAAAHPSLPCVVAQNIESACAFLLKDLSGKMVYATLRAHRTNDQHTCFDFEVFIANVVGTNEITAWLTK